MQYIAPYGWLFYAKSSKSGVVYVYIWYDSKSHFWLYNYLWGNAILRHPDAKSTTINRWLLVGYSRNQPWQTSNLISLSLPFLPSKSLNFFVHFISFYTNGFSRQNKVFGGLETMLAFGCAPKFTQCDEKWGLAKKCTLFWLRFVLGCCVQKYQLGYI